jgi:hypothetical protein
MTVGAIPVARCSIDATTGTRVEPPTRKSPAIGPAPRSVAVVTATV